MGFPFTCTFKFQIVDWMFELAFTYINIYKDLFNIWKSWCRWCICCDCTAGKWRACGILFNALYTDQKQVGAALCRWGVHIPSWWPSCDGSLLWKVKRQGDYIIYRDFMPEHISCQYSHLLVAARIHLIEIKVKRGELNRWKMSVANHDRIMETCITITHWQDEWKLYMQIFIHWHTWHAFEM